MLDRWIKCTGGDHRFVRIDSDLTTEETDEDAENWFRIYDEFISRYGLSKHYLKILNVMKELALLETRYANAMAKGTPDRFLETLISIEESKLKGLMEDNGRGMSVEQSLPALSEKIGSLIKARETTFVEYQNYLEYYARSSKA